MDSASLFGRLDLQMLRLLRTLYATQSLSKSAAMTDLSVSKASRILAQARELFGDQLFYRSSASMYPTKKMCALAERLDRIFEDLDGLIADESAMGFSDAESIVRIEATDNVFAVCVAPFLERISETLPHVSLEVLEPTGEGIERLKNNEIDFLIGFDPHLVLPANIRALTLLDAPHVYVVRQGNPVKAKLSADAETASAEGFFDECELVATPVKAPSGKRSAFLPPWAKKSPHMRSIVLMPYFLGAAHAVACSNRVMLVPAPLGELLCESTKIECVEPGTALEEPLEHWAPRLLWHASTDASPVRQFIRSTIVSGLKTRFPKYFVGKMLRETYRDE